MRVKSPGMYSKLLMTTFVPGLKALRTFLGARHNHVATDDEIGAAGRHADGVNVFRPVGDTDVAVDRPALLREAGHIDDADTLPFKMRGHPKDSRRW